ncbi:hypothetical protein C8F01DRAFT_1379496 [Mycena amicta]|nr:hypothetical protein C8F01DRAFT_1379496 [Mycena amicta]
MSDAPVNPPVNPPQPFAQPIPPPMETPPPPSLPPSTRATPEPTAETATMPAVVTRVKEKRSRHKKGEPKARPGKASWVYGTKKVFFSKRKEDWLREAEAGRSSQFYLKMAKLYILKYGRNLADDQDLSVDIEDPPDDAANLVVHEALTAEEEASRAAYLKLLRARIGQWYRLEYSSLLKSNKTAFEELFTGALDGAPPRPQRGRTIHFYSRKYYETRIKHLVEERLESFKRRAELDGQEMPKPIDVISKMTAEAWLAEMAAFRDEVELAAEREYQQTVKAWEASLADSPTRTPEEMAATLANAAYYLRPFAEAIQQRFGMCVSILLCGPIGEREGRIGVQSIHAGQTRGVAPMDWPTFDWQGYLDVETRMIEFGTQCFSEAECKARAVASKSGQHPSTYAPPPGVPPSTGPLPIPPSTIPPSPLSALPPTTIPPPDDIEHGQPSHHEQPADKPQRERSAKDVEIDMQWQRDDRAEWTSELGRAHAAFEVGRGWGGEWATCVQKFLDFEGAWGFVDGSSAMARAARPVQVSGWLTRGRKWTMPPALGGLLGSRQAVGMGAELWVGVWWGWWRSLQPAEREVLENGELSRPETADWSATAKMYGNNGLMLVMASLAWWGELVHTSRGDAIEAIDEWAAAVRDVTWVFEKLLGSGEIRKEAQAEGDVDVDVDMENDVIDDEVAKDAVDVDEEVNKEAREKSGTKRRKSKLSDDKADDESEGSAHPPKKRQRRKADQGEAADTAGPRRASRLRPDQPEETVQSLHVGSGARIVFQDPKYLDAFRFLEETLEAKLFKPNKIKVLPKGLLSVDDGWNRQRAHKISGVKLVYRIPDTPGLVDV